MENVRVLKKLLTLTGWKQFFSVLDKKEKIIFFILFISTLISGSFLLSNFYFKNTELKPGQGGNFTEGVIGHPRFINPIYSELSDVDRDLTELIFSGLLKYNSEGEIVPDLAKDYKILEDGKVYEFYLRDDVFWHDGKKLSNDDVIFTIRTIQNPEIKSPLFPNWLGIKVEKIGDLGIRFKLKEPYSAFIERATVKILPEHIWKDVPLVTSNLNLMPVGSGPYQFKGLEQDERGEIVSLGLTANQKYFGKFPNISQISFKFFDAEDELMKSAKDGEIDNFLILSKDSKFLKDFAFQKYKFSLLGYFAVFFNPAKNKALAEKEVRAALNYGTNKDEILEKILGNQGKIVKSPILPELLNFKEPSNVYQFNLTKAKEILEKAGFTEKDARLQSPSAPADGGQGKRLKIIKKEPSFQLKSNLKSGSEGKEVEELQKCLAQDKEVYPLGKIDGRFDTLTKKAIIRFQEKYKIEGENGKVLAKTRTKINEICFPIQEEIIPLKFSLVTVEQPMLKETAFLLKKQWESLGAEVNIKTLDIKILEREIIKPRDYEALLFGEVLGRIPDPFPFWHSSQREFGFNLSDYKNKKADELLEAGRTELSPESRAQKYEDFQDVLLEDAPAVFLYNPDYIYLSSKKVNGIREGLITDPSKRFAGIEDWYIKTKRVWK
ncbi:peptidoglycan-binding protein [Patescibacteria group bacterium]|nr:peptidoglycan-binding protein [Patescibacteria group bacterium]